MPAEIPFPAPGDPTLGLIETFAWSREGGYALLAEHRARLERSAGVGRYAFDAAAILHRLDAFAAGFDPPRCRVRMVLFPDGRLDLSFAPLGEPAALYRVAVAEARFRSDDPWVRHKTTRRDRYEQPLAEAIAASGADEVLFLNERDELCEGARHTLFVAREGRLLTPPLRCGLLPGTLRAHLLHSGQAHEAVLRLADLGAGAEWFMGNSVRGLVPAVLLGL